MTKAKTKPDYKPSMADAAVKAKTGKDWAGWFGALDRAGARQLDHRSIAQLLSRQFSVPGWWSQMVTVEYERARGLRERHQTASGFQVGVSKTVAAGLHELYTATANAAQRRKWFPRGTFEPSSHTQDKYLRGSWKRGARLEIGFYAKGAHKSQIALQLSKLTKRSDVEAERRAWRTAVERLQTLLAQAG